MEGNVFYSSTAANKTLLTFSPVDKNQDGYYLKNIKSLIIDKTTNREDNDQFQLLDYPPDYIQEKKTKVKYWGIAQNKKFEALLNDLYINNPNELVTHLLPNKGKLINYFKFNDVLAKFTFRAVEVSCRVISHFEGSQDNSNGKNIGGKIPNDSKNTNLNRIGNIKFKGDLHGLIENLLNKCISIIKKHMPKVNEVQNDAVCYINSRWCNHLPSLNWSCRKIENIAIENDETIRKLYNSHAQQMYKNEISGEPHLCFFQRQMIGHAFLPFIDLNDSISKGNTIDANCDGDDMIKIDEEGRIEVKSDYFYQQPTNNDNLLFDNVFISCTGNLKEDIKRSVWGIYKKDINCVTDNFLTVGNGVCSALMDFSLDRIGLTGSGINLYIKPLPNAPIYFTNVKSEIEIPSAGEYLTNLCLESKNYQNHLIENGLASPSSFTNAYSALSFTNYINKTTEGYNNNNNNNNNMKRTRFDDERSNNNNMKRTRFDNDDKREEYDYKNNNDNDDDDDDDDDDKEEEEEEEKRRRRMYEKKLKKMKKSKNEKEKKDTFGKKPNKKKYDDDDDDAANATLVADDDDNNDDYARRKIKNDIDIKERKKQKMIKKKTMKSQLSSSAILPTTQKPYNNADKDEIIKESNSKKDKMIPSPSSSLLLQQDNNMEEEKNRNDNDYNNDNNNNEAKMDSRKNNNKEDDDEKGEGKRIKRKKGRKKSRESFNDFSYSSTTMSSSSSSSPSSSSSCEEDANDE